MSERLRTGTITASEHRIEIGSIPTPYLYTGNRHINTVGGTALISERGAPRATMSFLAFRNNTERYTPYAKPILFVMNGGPSSPATLGHALGLMGAYYIQHDDDGHLRKANWPAEVRLAINEESPVWACETVHIDPIGTGLGYILEDVDPNWAFNSETDAESAAAVMEWYCKAIACEDGLPLADRPIFMAGSSFHARRAALIILELARRGIRVSGLAMNSGSYDVSLHDYANTDDPRPFATGLPTIAACAHYHAKNDPKIQTLFPLDVSDQAAFEAAREFAESEYAQALVTDRLPGRRRQAIASKLANLTGLPTDLVQDHDLRISPRLFRQELFANECQVLSAIDGRLKFPAVNYHIDPALDNWQEFYRQAQLQGVLANGYPNSFHSNEYQGILKDPPEWRYNGLSADRRAHEAMARIIGRSGINPDMTISASNGFYDMLTPAPSTEVFWREMHKQHDIPLRRHTLDSYDFHFPQQAGIDSYILPIGHQPTMPGFSDARHLIARIIRRMVRYDNPLKLP